MAPVLERLGEADTLFLAPDAALNLIPFAALHDGERYLVERYPLHTLTTGRDLLHPWDTGATAGQAVVVVANPTGAKLPGTEREAELLGELFPHAETLLHDAATEAGAQRHTQPWLMHLATHGFFDPPKRDAKHEAMMAAMAEYQQSMSPSMMQFAPGRIDNPMQRAGLVLAPSTPTTPTTDNETETEADTDLWIRKCLRLDQQCFRFADAGSRRPEIGVKHNSDGHEFAVAQAVCRVKEIGAVRGF